MLSAITATASFPTVVSLAILVTLLLSPIFPWTKTAKITFIFEGCRMKR